MKKLVLSLICLASLASVNAQQVFVKSAKIIFEKKVNLLRQMADDKSIPDIIKENIGKYEISNWEYVFNENFSIYQNQNSGTSMSVDKSQIFTNFNKRMRTVKKAMLDNYYILADSIPKLNWKILPEVRTIAGYKCRKAIAVINDSVYVVAFYTSEIVPMGGPEGFTGLPGMIMGLAIPRYYTTWFATLVQNVNVPEEIILAPVNGRKLEDSSNLRKLVEAYNLFTNAKTNTKTEEQIKRLVFGFLL